MDELSNLLSLIQSNGEQLLKVCEQNSQSWPSVHDPYSPAKEQIRRHPDIQKPLNLVLAAAKQLVAALEEPNITIKNHSFSVSLFLIIPNKLTEWLGATVFLAKDRRGSARA